MIKQFINTETDLGLARGKIQKSKAFFELRKCTHKNWE